MTVLGLDEAGRGAVLGPLVVGAYLVDDDKLEALAATGVTDSKKLSPAKREALRDPLDALGRWDVRAISAKTIDGENLNRLEEKAFVDLILQFRPDKVIIDAPCHPNGIPFFIERLVEAIGYRPELVVEPKADLNYKPCGAASIFAKTDRDRAIHALGPVGSGYPGDPVTRAWIKGFFDRDEPLPACVRSRWGTIATLSQRTLF